MYSETKNLIVITLFAAAIFLAAMVYYAKIEKNLRMSVQDGRIPIVDSSGFGFDDNNSLI
jgi:hypothetical protein